MLKSFHIWSSGSPPVSCSKIIYAILKEGIFGNIHVKIYGNWTCGSKMSLKDISYLEPWQLFCSAECNHLCNFVRGYYEEQFCEIILELDQWFSRRYRLKDFLSGTLVALLFGETFI